MHRVIDKRKHRGLDKRKHRVMDKRKHRVIRQERLCDDPVVSLLSFKTRHLVIQDKKRFQAIFLNIGYEDSIIIKKRNINYPYLQNTRTFL